MSEFIEYVGYSLLRALGRALSYEWADALGMAAGRYAFSLFGVRRRVSMENLRHAFPGRPDADIRRIARDAAGNYGRTMMLFFWSSAREASEINAHLHFRGAHIATESAALGRGLIVLSGHFGAWELFPNAFATQLNLPMLIIAHTQRNARVNAVVVRDRNRFGNRIVSMATYRGPAVFSLRQGSPIVMPMMVRRPDRGYDIVIEKVETSDLTGQTEENIRLLTERHTAVLERYVRMYPDQWLWAHKRWKHTEYFLTRERSSRPQADARAS